MKQHYSSWDQHQKCHLAEVRGDVIKVDDQIQTHTVSRNSPLKNTAQWDGFLVLLPCAGISFNTFRPTHKNIHTYIHYVWITIDLTITQNGYKMMSHNRQNIQTSIVHSAKFLEECVFVCVCVCGGGGGDMPKRINTRGKLHYWFIIHTYEKAFTRIIGHS
jgi:hypothetical protein